MTVLIVVAVLYFARTILIPLALAVLLAFLLAPVVNWLERWGLPRIPAVLSVVLCLFVVIGVLGTLLASQLTDLGHKLPEYQQNVHKKLESIRNSGDGFINGISRVARNLTEELSPRGAAPAKNKPGEEKPVPVEIHHLPFSPLEAIQKVLGSLLNVLVVIGIVIVFVIFILIQQEDLRDRLIELAGSRRISKTTKLLDDAAHRVGRYLLAQLVVNVGYGVLAGTAVYFIGIPNPLLWAALAALLRYIPYLGIWIAAAMPATVAFAVEPGWVKGPLVFGIYFAIDLLMYNLVEPLLYGTSTGVSPLAVLVAAVFWTWLWGPAGLLLATPLTVCVVVIGRHVPNLGFLRVLLSDEPVLPPPVRFYQRMLALDLEEATDVAEEFLKGKSLEEVYDGLLVPGMSLAEADRHHEKLDEKQQQFFFQNTRLLIEELADRAEELVAANPPSKLRNGEKIEAPTKPAVVEAAVLCIPARDEADELAVLMLVQLLKKRGVPAKALSAAPLAGESLTAVEQERPDVVCVCAVPPNGFTHVRYLCRRLRAQFRELHLVAAILTEGDVDELKRRRPPIPVDELAASLKQAQTYTLSLAQTQPERSEAGLRAA